MWSILSTLRVTCTTITEEHGNFYGSFSTKILGLFSPSYEKQKCNRKVEIRCIHKNKQRTNNITSLHYLYSHLIYLRLSSHRVKVNCSVVFCQETIVWTFSNWTEKKVAFRCEFNVKGRLNTDNSPQNFWTTFLEHDFTEKLKKSAAPLPLCFSCFVLLRRFRENLTKPFCFYLSRTCGSPGGTPSVTQCYKKKVNEPLKWHSRDCLSGQG